ncbi:MAG: hypothetical protein H6887_09635 [Hoeflea sp.]|nr:hypothetical protein [Hoeflea sp.]
MKYEAAGRSDNALQRVVFIIEFAQEFTQADYAFFDKNARNWRTELPRRSLTNAVLFTPGSNQVAASNENIVSCSYESMMPDGRIEFGLRFEERRILFLAGRYTRWSDIWPRAKKHLSNAISLVLDNNSIVSFGTEYNDLFRATGEYLDFDPKEILRTESQYIPPYIFNRNENFHFHTGFFETAICESAEETSSYRILTRINADLQDNDEEKARELSIVLFHQISLYREPWVGPKPLPKEILDRGLDNFVHLHELDKQVLQSILNEQMSLTIGLSE